MVWGRNPKHSLLKVCKKGCQAGKLNPSSLTWNHPNAWTRGERAAHESKQRLFQKHNPLCCSFGVLVRFSEQSKPCKSQFRGQGWAGWRSNTPTGAPKHSRVVWGDSRGKGLQVQPDSGSSGHKSLYKPLLPLCHLHNLCKNIPSTLTGSTPHPSYSNYSFCRNGKWSADTLAT